MSIERSDILAALARLQLPDGGDLVSRDFIRAVTIDGGTVRYVIEAPNPDVARKLAVIRGAAEQIVLQLDGRTSVWAVVTAHADKAPSSNL